jgi:hypothetical protein
MTITSSSSAISTQNLQAVQSEAQINVLKKANTQQADQVKQLLQAQADQQAQAQAQQQQAAAAGRPGGVINTYA